MELHTSPVQPATSSPAAVSSRASTRPKRPPPITPKRFNRFFNPRSSNSSLQQSRAGRQLRDITASGINGANADVDFEDLPRLKPRKRRRLDDQENEADIDDVEPSSAPCSSPLLRSSPCTQGLSTRRSTHQADQVYKDEELHEREEDVSDEEDSAYDFPPAIARARLPQLRASYESATANFYSRADESHIEDPNLSLPFCTTACHNESIIAVGDELGSISLLETNGDNNPPFRTPIVTFQPHKNALMDMSFSSDDRKLATGSGDQSGRIIDVATQTTLLYLFEHSSSVKQVAFQPGNDDVVASCSRDGLVAIWDLRVQQPVSRIQIPGGVAVPHDARQASRYSVIAGGHSADAWTAFPRSKPGARPLPSRRPSEATSGREPSVTALHFLPQHPHLLLSASDASSVLRLWDLRARYSPRTASAPTPLSLTSPLHTTTSASGKARSFGVTSLALSTDAARTYALCRDSAVYVYSTPHLLLGSDYTAPTTAAAPLYALRNASFTASSFYVKAALRPAAGAQDEILALGSGTGTPVLIPTRAPQLGLCSSEFTSAGVPAYGIGTPLAGGHTREVTAMAWTRAGELVSLGDDRRVRVWREDRDTASVLRGWETRTERDGVREHILESGGREGWGYSSVGETWDIEDS